ncbi:MAG: REP-associated tyrosine transposase [Gaiellaceae bacterium]
MPRPLRLQPAGGIFHLTTRGNRRGEIVRDDEDCGEFVALLEDVISRFDWRCHSYCLMTNHYHLLVETTNENLSMGMHRLNGFHARRFNRRHGLTGHLFERRFHSILVESEFHLLELCRYIVLNPVRAGLCASPADWPWSSYRAAAGLAPAAPFLTVDWSLGLFGSDKDLAQRSFQSFVAAGLRAAA